MKHEQKTDLSLTYLELFFHCSIQIQTPDLLLIFLNNETLQVTIFSCLSILPLHIRKHSRWHTRWNLLEMKESKMGIYSNMQNRVTMPTPRNCRIQSSTPSVVQSQHNVTSELNNPQLRLPEVEPLHLHWEPSLANARHNSTITAQTFYHSVRGIRIPSQSVTPHRRKPEQVPGIMLLRNTCTLST